MWYLSEVIITSLSSGKMVLLISGVRRANNSILLEESSRKAFQLRGIFTFAATFFRLPFPLLLRGLSFKIAGLWSSHTISVLDALVRVRPAKGTKKSLAYSAKVTADEVGTARTITAPSNTFASNWSGGWFPSAVSLVRHSIRSHFQNRIDTHEWFPCRF